MHPLWLLLSAPWSHQLLHLKSDVLQSLKLLSFTDGETEAQKEEGSHHIVGQWQSQDIAQISESLAPFPSQHLHGAAWEEMSQEVLPEPARLLRENRSHSPGVPPRADAVGPTGSGLLLTLQAMEWRDPQGKLPSALHSSQSLPHPPANSELTSDTPGQPADRRASHLPW